jgi:hypothetical protein
MRLDQDFKEFIALLNEHEVRYLIVGGYAVAVHGHPRYTKDLDVWILTETGNADRLLSALEEFGFGSLGLTRGDFVTRDQVIQLGYPPNRIDILTSLEGVSFEDCYDSRAVVELEGLLVPFISLDDLRKNKRALGRHQDLADLENLK